MGYAYDVQEEARYSISVIPSCRYVGLFPMLVRMLPGDSSELGGLLKGMADPGELWTQHGLRSLSKNSSIYNQYNTEHDAPYWRAPVWLNINFLALSALKHYSQVCPCSPGHQQCRSITCTTLQASCSCVLDLDAIAFAAGPGAESGAGRTALHSSEEKHPKQCGKAVSADRIPVGELQG